MKYNSILLNNEGSLTLVIIIHSRKFRLKFSTLEGIQKYCDKHNIEIPEPFSSSYGRLKFAK